MDLNGVCVCVCKQMCVHKGVMIVEWGGGDQEM